MCDGVDAISSLVNTLRRAENEVETVPKSATVQVSWDILLQNANDTSAHRQPKPIPALLYNKTKLRKPTKPARPRVLPKMHTKHDRSREQEQIAANKPT